MKKSRLSTNPGAPLSFGLRGKSADSLVEIELTLSQL